MANNRLDRIQEFITKECPLSVTRAERNLIIDSSTSYCKVTVMMVHDESNDTIKVRVCVDSAILTIDQAELIGKKLQYLALVVREAEEASTPQDLNG